MALTNKHLQELQAAGQAVHKATTSIANLVQETASGTLATIAKNPFGPESDDDLAQYRAIAKLSKQLTDLESQLREVYSDASGLLRSPVLAIKKPQKKPGAKLNTAKKSAGLTDSTAVIPDPVKTKKAKSATSKVVAKPKGDAEPKVKNTEKLLQYLRTVLNDQTPTAVKANPAAHATGIPTGSITATFQRLIRAGQILDVGQGSYQLPLAEQPA